jgi:hypothetical protein
VKTATNQSETAPTLEENWCELVGKTVEIRIGSRFIRRAEVEAATTDSCNIWLRAEGNDGRQLISRTDGYRISVVTLPETCCP